MNEQILTPLIFILLGWLLGFFGTQLNKILKRNKNKKDFIICLSTELKELIPQITNLVFVLNSHIGCFNKDDINWIIKINSIYNIEKPEIITFLNPLLKMKDNQIKAITNFLKEQQGVSKDIRKINLIYLDSNIAYLMLLNSEIQLIIFTLRKRIFWINELIDRNIFFNEQTFDSSLSDGNRKIIDINLKNNYIHMAKMYKEIVDIIINVLKDLNN